MGTLRPTDFYDFQGGVAFSGGMTLPSNAISTDSQIKAGANITRAKLVQEDAVAFTMPIINARVWDSGALLPTSAGGADDLYLSVGTLGTDAPILKSNDANGTTVLQYAAMQQELPECYEAGETVTIRIPAKVEAICDTTNALDVQCYEDDCNGGGATDICATASQTMTASWVNYDFTITPTSLVKGDVLWFRISSNLVDGGSGANRIVNIGSPRLLLDIRA